MFTISNNGAISTDDFKIIDMLNAINNSFVKENLTWRNYVEGYQLTDLQRVILYKLCNNGEQTTSIRTTSMTYSNDNAQLDNLQSILEAHKLNDTSSKIRVHIKECKRRFTILEQHLDECQEALKEQGVIRLKTIEPLLTTEQRQHVRIYMNSCKCVTILTTEPNRDVFLTNILTTLPFMYPDLLKRLQEEEAEDPEGNTLRLLRAVATEDIADIQHILTTISEGVADTSYAKLINTVRTTMSRRNNEDITRAEITVTENERRLKDAYTVATDISKKLLASQKQLSMLLAFPTSIDEAALTFLQNNRHTVEVMSNGDTSLELKITTPLAFYAVNDVLFWYKHPEVPNNVTERPWLAQLITDTFVKRLYTITLTTLISVPWNGDVNSFYTNNPTNIFGNPHLTHFNCFSSTKHAVANSLAKNDVLTALNQLIACCSSIAFTDSTVVGRFVGDLTSRHKDEKVFTDNLTGLQFSAAEYKQCYKELNDTNDGGTEE